MNHLYLSQTLHPYPMMRGAGLFVLLVGLGITIGGVLGKKYVMPMLIAGGVLAIQLIQLECAIASLSSSFLAMLLECNSRAAGQFRR